MDVGLFKASKGRLVAWIVVPPVLITSVGLSTFSLQQRAQWQLKETRALSNVLPDIMHARKNVQQLYDDMGLTEATRIDTGDKLIGLLEEKARLRNIDLKKTQILERNTPGDSPIPTISVMLDATGKFNDFQRFLNEVKSAYPLVSARSITLDQDKESAEGEGFEIRAVFDLMLVNDLMKATGGSQ